MPRRVRIPAGQPTLFSEFSITADAQIHEDAFHESLPAAEGQAFAWDPFSGLVHPSLLERKIIHVDMDAFYASIEELDHPEYRGKPLIVGGRPQGRGVVATCNYMARASGVRSAMSAARAARLCPEALFVRPRFERYVEISHTIKQILLGATPLVEPLSLDEAYLDVTEVCVRDGVTATDLAKRLRADIQKETGLTASAGVAPNKMVAKIASDVNKPDGLCVVRPERVFEFMLSLPARRIPFVGPRTDARLAALGLRVCEDLVRAGPERLADVAGSWGEGLWWRAQGIDFGSVRTSRERKSCGEEQTFAKDLTTREEMLVALKSIAESLWSHVEKRGFSGRTLTLKVKFHDFSSVTRRRTFSHVVCGAEEFLCVGGSLLLQTEASLFPVRLLGLSLSNLAEIESMPRSETSCAGSQEIWPFCAPDDKEGAK